MTDEITQAVTPVTVGAVAAHLNAKLSGDPNAVVADVTHDSRQVGENVLFAAIRGFSVDGHRFVADVMRRGATGVISELERPANFQGAWLQVENARAALAEAADIVNNFPSRQLKLVGITGTNGKTTTTYLINALANAAGEQSAMLTTVEYRINDASQPAVRTTPEASDTQRFLRQAVAAGCRAAAMEASSQALDLRRCDGLRFAAAIFTNLTPDHLDYHGTMEDYFDAKKRLFDGRTGEVPSVSVINIDDEYGVRLIEELRAHKQKVISFGLTKTDAADYSAVNVETDIIGGTRFDLVANGETVELQSPLVGRPHVYNILAAVAAARELGHDWDSIKRGIAVCAGAPGRFERVAHTGNFAVVVDYAHTEDALENVLKTARDFGTGRVITVFGCGGDRDRLKRRPMGAVAGRLSDFVVITSDNPRGENPDAIINEITRGIRQTNAFYVKISDRRAAIQCAVENARGGDVVLIAGKGHETYQIIGENRFHFDDREVAREILAKRELEGA